MTRFFSTLFFLMILVSSPSLVHGAYLAPWEFLGAQDDLLNGVCSSGPYLFATTEEGLYFYNHQTGQWTDRTWPDWIGKGKYAAVLGQTHDQRLVTGGVNAWFKGTLFYSDDMGETETLVLESQGGQVTDLAASLFDDPALYACTWSDVVAGEFLRSDDDGESWSLITGHGHHTMTDLAVIGPDEVFLAGNNYVTHTFNGGITWENLQGNLPVGQGIYCILALPAVSVPAENKIETHADILLASNDSGLFSYDFETGLWQMVLPASCRSLSQRHHFGWNETFAVTWDGRIMCCQNQDWENWLDVTNELSPGIPMDVEANFYGVHVAMQGGGVFHSSGLMGFSDVPSHEPLLSIHTFPNPFNPATTIQFKVPDAGHALLQVFDLRGALVATLVDGEVTAGTNSCSWQPQGLGSGVYRTILQFNGKTVTSSVVLLK